MNKQKSRNKLSSFFKKVFDNNIQGNGLLLMLILMMFVLFGCATINDSIVSINKNVESEVDRFFIKTLNSDSDTVKEYTLSAEIKDISLFGKTSTSMYVYNGQSPGPILRGKVGDTFKINFENNLDVESTIHWHGMQIENSMDGVPGITQESVKPQETYKYEFSIKNPGIYWYHPHYATEEQIEKGLQGVIIVDDETKVINSDKDIVYVLDDILLKNNNEIVESGYGHMETMHGRHGNKMLINGQESFDITGKKGELIRLRLINTANGRTFNFAIEGHKLLVVGHDIGLVDKPYEVDNLYISPGERYDVLIYLNNVFGEYEIQDYKTKMKNILGKLTYTKNKENENNNDEHYKYLKENKLNNNLPDWSDKLDPKENFTLELSGKGNMMDLTWTINGKTYPNGQENFDLKEGNFYKMKFVNTQNQIHPMHIHGQKFLILTRNGEEIKEKGWKDTVLIYGKEIVEIGFIAEGKGVWVEHCHILEHAKAGMLNTLTIT